jgi:hypothetical protein
MKGRVSRQLRSVAVNPLLLCRRDPIRLVGMFRHTSVRQSRTAHLTFVLRRNRSGDAPDRDDCIWVLPSIGDADSAEFRLPKGSVSVNLSLAL